MAALQPGRPRSNGCQLGQPARQALCRPRTHFPARLDLRRSARTQVTRHNNLRLENSGSTGIASLMRSKFLRPDEASYPRPDSSVHKTLCSSENETETDPEALAMELERLERELAAAVETEDYSAAAQLRDKLKRLQEDEEAAVVGSNALFYRAFQNSDMRRMRQVWSQGDHVQCIHPGANCIQGYDSVMESWDLVLSGERRLTIDVENLRCYIRGSMAFVTCVEVLRSDGASGRVIATNIFEKRGSQWLMVHHQGAAAPPSALFA